MKSKQLTPPFHAKGPVNITVSSHLSGGSFIRGFTCPGVSRVRVTLTVTVRVSRVSVMVSVSTVTVMQPRTSEPPDK